MACCHGQTPSGCQKIVVIGIATASLASIAYCLYNFSVWYRGGKHLYLRPPKPYLTNKHEPKSVTLISKEVVTHDVRLFKFEIPKSDQTLGILAGEHIKVTADIGSRTMFRFYSPISEPEQRGYFEIIMKIYPPTPELPNNGIFSTHMDSLPIGSELSISGPFGRFGYLSNGDFLVNTKAIMRYKAIAMISGGSGLTPMLPIIRKVIQEPTGPKLSLIYSNKTEEDVIQSDELKQYAHTIDTFKLTLVYTRLFENSQDRLNPTKWVEHFSRIDEGLLARVFPYPREDVLVLICGPKGMNDAAKVICTSLGYPNIHVF